jgi:hypothetical protein
MSQALKTYSKKGRPFIMCRGIEQLCLATHPEERMGLRGRSRAEPNQIWQSDMSGPKSESTSEIIGETFMLDRSDFPTMDQVEKATREQLARWYRFLPSGDTPDQKKVCDRIAERFKKLGGMTPSLEKRIGYLN